VGQNSKVTIRNVKTGNRLGSMWIIESGLLPGERVVTEGLAKAADGATVNPKPEAAKPDTSRPDTSEPVK
jgi:multidrug efflux pump subunit AcrA (membrane-fusion protein)